jgi:hypothetical protein
VCGRIGGQAIKALIFKVCEGQYDDYHEWIIGVFLVPIRFKEDAERSHFYDTLKNNGSVKFKKNGKPYQKDVASLEELYFTELKSRYHFLPFVEVISPIERLEAFARGKGLL